MRRADRLYFAKVPDRIADHPQCTPARLAVAWAVIRACGLKGYCTETIDELMAAARLSRNPVSQAVAWLIRIGEFESQDDFDVRSNRRLVWVGATISTEAAMHESHKRAGASQEVWGRAPGGMGARARRYGGARQEVLPLKEEEISEEGERDVPSHPLPESRGLAAPTSPDRYGTGRDVLAPLTGEGSPESAGIEARIAEAERALKAERPGSDAARKLRGVLIGLRNDLAALAAPPAPPPAPAPPTSPPARAAPAPGSLDESVALCLRGPAAADLFAAHHAAWLGEPDNPITIETLQDAATLLRPDWLARQVRSTARASPEGRPKLLAKILAKELKRKRRSLDG